MTIQKAEEGKKGRRGSRLGIALGFAAVIAIPAIALTGAVLSRRGAPGADAAPALTIGRHTGTYAGFERTINADGADTATLLIRMSGGRYGKASLPEGLAERMLPRGPERTRSIEVEVGADGAARSVTLRE